MVGLEFLACVASACTEQAMFTVYSKLFEWPGSDVIIFIARSGLHKRIKCSAWLTTTYLVKTVMIAL